MDHLHVTEELYGSQLVIMTGLRSEEEIEGILKDVSGSYWDVSKFATEHPDSEGVSWDCGANQLVWVKFPEAPNVLQILAHELVHAAFGLADYLGFKNHIETQEFHARYVEWGLRSYIKWAEQLKIDESSGNVKLS